MAVCSDWNMNDMIVFGKDMFSDSKRLASESVSMVLMVGAAMLGLSGLYRKVRLNHNQWLKTSVKSMHFPPRFYCKFF